MIKQHAILPKLLSRDGAIQRIAAILASLPIEQAWRVEWCEHKARRSEQQNRYIWAIYTHILRVGGESMAGWTKDDLHTFFLGEFSGWEKRILFGRTRMVPMRRSSRMNKQDFTDYVDSISSFMAQRGVYIPTPDDDWEAVVLDSEAA